MPTSSHALTKSASERDSIVSDISVSENESAVKRDCLLLESSKEGDLLKDVGRMVRHFLNTNSSIKDENVRQSDTHPTHLPIPSHPSP